MSTFRLAPRKLTRASAGHENSTMEDRRPSAASPLLDGDPPTSSQASVRGPPANSFDLAAFRTYLAQLLPLLIAADPTDLETLFERADFGERATRWASDPNAGALYVVKNRDEHEVDPERGVQLL